MVTLEWNFKNVLPTSRQTHKELLECSKDEVEAIKIEGNNSTCIFRKMSWIIRNKLIYDHIICYILKSNFQSNKNVIINA
jgi:hypothetical protein